MKKFLITHYRWLLAATLVATIASGLLVTRLQTSHARGLAAKFQPASVNGGLVSSDITPPSDADCRKELGRPCYSPQEIRKAYNIQPLLDAGFTGKGQTIVIIDSFGNPTVEKDLKTFDAAYGLPDPPSFKILTPLGTTKFDPTDGDMLSWAFETNLDVQWAHAIAPDANIVLLTSPTSETQGVQGMPEFLQLEQYALDNHLGKIISQSWGTAENDLFDDEGQKVFDGFESFYQKATAENVTLLAAAGDLGTANLDVDGNYYNKQTVQYPASSPYVTSVGGTSLTADTEGNYQSEVVWNVSSRNVATGGGVSQYFDEPSYQKVLPKAVQKLLNGHRGIPDIAYSSDRGNPVLVYASYLTPGFYSTGGTSLGSPQWAGIVALANQYSNRSLGHINPSLYLLGASPLADKFFHDITQGNNGGVNKVPGYNAWPGWDACTGFGSPKAESLVQALSKIPSLPLKK